MDYGALKDFQSGIVGLIGFGGAIITLWWNGRLARVARGEQAEQTKMTILTALQEELQCILQELKSIDRNIRREPACAFGFTLEQPYVYRALIKDIGVLEPDRARVVIRVHRDLYLLMNSIRSLANNPDQSIAELPPESFPEALQYVTHAVELGAGAIEALSADRRAMPPARAHR
jgi:hypothetical protein